MKETTQSMSSKQKNSEDFSIVNDLVAKLLAISTDKQLETKVSESIIIQLCQQAKQVFLSQPPLLELNAPIKICGDIHGQFPDLLHIFNKGGSPPTSNYLFLGDYVDRGRQNLETICLLLCYKIKYPSNFYLLRGNHECSAINRVYGFYDECCRRYQSNRLWNVFQDVFNVMPFCALIKERILCMHGGLSPKLKTLEQLRDIQRPVDPPNPSMLVDILWSDPDPSIKGWKANEIRGLSYLFGPDVVHNACTKFNIELIVRAHQMVPNGYEFFANKKLITLFSAPNYCGEFGNAAAIMHVNENLVCSFEVFKGSQN